MKIAVTGAAGFIGRHVAAELAKHPVEVVLISRPGKTEPATRAGERWLNLDLAHPPANVFEYLGCPDVLLHLAWQGLPNYRALHHIEVELPRHYAFLNQLVRQGLKCLIGVGTSLEYGQQSGALAEQVETRPDCAYGFAKDGLRKQLQFLQSASPYRFTWARLFYMHGEGQAATSLLAQLKRAVESGLPAFDMSGGEQLRDYLPVSEVARYLAWLARQRANLGALNICSGKPISVRRLVEGWIRDNGWKIELNLGHFPYPDYEPMAFWGMNQKLIAAMGEADGGRARPSPPA